VVRRAERARRSGFIVYIGMVFRLAGTLGIWDRMRARRLCMSVLDGKSDPHNGSE